MLPAMVYPDSVGILGLRHDLKFSWVYNAEFISNRIA